MKQYVISDRIPGKVEQVILTDRGTIFGGPFEVQECLSQVEIGLAMQGAKLLDVTEKCDKQWLNEGQKVFEVVEA